jgi:hypothetical protein
VLIIVAADLIRFVSLIQVTSLLVLISSARRMGLPGGGALPPLLRGPACLTALAALELGSSLVLTHGAPILERAPFVVIPNY